MVIYAYFKAILGPFTVISYTSKGGMKYSVMPRLTQDYYLELPQDPSEAAVNGPRIALKYA